MKVDIVSLRFANCREIYMVAVHRRHDVSVPLDYNDLLLQLLNECEEAGLTIDFIHADAMM